MSKNYIHYKNYIAELKLDFEEDIIVGKVVNAADIISFHGKTLKEARNAFHDVLDTYLETSKELGIEPAKPCSGKFNLRISPELHRKLNIIAKTKNKSLNDDTQELIHNGIEQFEQTQNIPI